MTRITTRAAVAAIVTTTALGTLAAAAPATAGTYEVWTCRAPDGTPAPTQDASGGWASSTENTSAGGGNVMRDDCNARGAISAAIAATLSQPAPSWLFWRFHAPSATTIRRYDVELDGYTRTKAESPGVRGDLAVSTSVQSDPDYDARFPGVGPTARQVVSADGRGSAFVQVLVSCAPFTATECSPAADGAPARVNIYRGTFLLEDRDAPTVTSVSGDAVSNATWAGPTAVSVAAGDQGGGVRRLGVEVDGQIQSWIPLAGGACEAWPGTERTFLSPQPCPSTVAGVQTISTADLPEGPHRVRVLVEDAAGNQTTAYGPTTKTLLRSSVGVAGGTGTSPGGGSVADPGPLNGTPAVADARLRAQWQGTEGATRSIAFNGRPTISGQLTTPTGQPIRDAFLRVTIKRDARNSPAFDRDSLKTDSRGRFRWKMPAGVSSRTIKLSYHLHVRDAKPAVSRALTLRVAAGVRLALSRTVVRARQAVKLTGLVVGRPVPRIGKVVELQARNVGGRWITFKTVRSKKSGRFSASYRFRKAGPARFQMRARVRKSGDYPYATGASPVRRIRVR